MLLSYSVMSEDVSGQSPNQNGENMNNIDDKHPENCTCAACLQKSLTDYFRTGLVWGAISPDKLIWDGKTEEPVKLNEAVGYCFDGCRCDKCREHRKNATFNFIVNNGQFMDFGPIEGLEK